MKRTLRLCLSFIIRRRQAADDRPLPQTCCHCCGVGCHKRINFLRTSRSWSKIPLTSISEHDEDMESSTVSSTAESNTEFEISEAEHEKRVPDLTTVCFSSSRFFFSAPGSSSSIIETATTPLLSSSEKVMAGCSVAVETYSVNPYIDFKRSMQEMIDASWLMKMDTAGRWSFLHELLLCYLALNHKTKHKLIISAFADLLVNLVVADN